MTFAFAQGDPHNDLHGPDVTLRHLMDDAASQLARAARSSQPGLGADPADRTTAPPRTSDVAIRALTPSQAITRPLCTIAMRSLMVNALFMSCVTTMLVMLSRSCRPVIR